MHALHCCSNYQNYLNRICLLLALIFLSFFVLSGTLLRSVHADGGDLLQNIPPVNENSIDNAACGVAAATMILDYYLPQSGSVHTPPDIHTVAKYVKEDSQGTTGSDLQTGIEAAALAYGNHSNTSWDATDSANWFTTLKSELDEMRPVIV